MAPVNGAVYSQVLRRPAPDARSGIKRRIHARDRVDSRGSHGRGRRRRGRMVHNATAYSCLRSMTAITEVARELDAELERLDE